MGLLHYKTDKKCPIQLWHDKITGKKRWWFGVSFNTKKDVDEFIEIAGLENVQAFTNRFEENWALGVVREKWSGEKEYYLGIYSKSGKESQAIRKFISILGAFSDYDYLRLNRKYGSGEGKDHFKLKIYI